VRLLSDADRETGEWKWSRNSLGVGPTSSFSDIKLWAEKLSPPFCLNSWSNLAALHSRTTVTLEADA
jgi:hypothetical protein